jgi:hypothetical protein
VSGALASLLRRAQSSLYQPFAESQPDEPEQAAPKATRPAPVVVMTPMPRTAKIIPFPASAKPHSAEREDHAPHFVPPQKTVLQWKRLPPHKVPGLAVALSPQAGLR